MPHNPHAHILTVLLTLCALVLNNGIVKINHNVCILIQRITGYNAKPDNDYYQPLQDLLQNCLMLL